jgi:hypothetical protein
MAVVNTTDDKVRQAAASCPVAADTLKTLFPEVFQSKLVRFDSVRGGSLTSLALNPNDLYSGRVEITPRSGGQFMGQGLYLPAAIGRFGIDWKIEKDREGATVLVGYIKTN